MAQAAYKKYVGWGLPKKPMTIDGVVFRASSGTIIIPAQIVRDFEGLPVIAEGLKRGSITGQDYDEPTASPFWGPMPVAEEVQPPTPKQQEAIDDYLAVTKGEADGEEISAPQEDSIIEEPEPEREKPGRKRNKVQE